MLAVPRTISSDIPSTQRRSSLASSRPCRPRTTAVRANIDVQALVDRSNPSAKLSQALKEWAVTCGALGKGDQTVILRKGGIREPTFKVPARTFLLFPTSFHSKADLLTPQANAKYQQELAAEPKDQAELTISHLASVTGCWETFDPAVLAALSEHHVWTEAFLDSRLRWRPKQPITVLELRCRQLQQPLVVPNKESYWGCFSWVDLAMSVNQAAIHSAQKVIEDTDFVDRQEQVRQALAGIKDCVDLLKEIPYKD